MGWRVPHLVCGRCVAVAEEDKAIIGSFAKNFLPILFALYSEPTNVHRASVLKTVEAYASVAPSQLINSLFMQAMKKLLEVGRLDFYLLY